MSIDDLKRRMADVTGIENLTMQVIGNRQMFSIGGKVIGLPLGASDADIEGTIRAGLNSTLTVAEIIKVPDVPAAPAKPVQAPKPAPASGGFAAAIKAMVSDAKAGLEQAKADGLAEVQGAIGRLGEAKTAVKHVTSSMAHSIHGQVDDVMAELGQISNDLSGEA